MKKEFIKNFILENNGDGIMLYSKFNRYWFLNIDSSFAIIFINKYKEIIYITDSRYFLAAKQALINEPAIKVWCTGNDEANKLTSLIKKAIEELKITNLLIERDYLNLDQWELVKNYHCKAIETSWMRSIKTDHEIVKLQQAADIIVQVLNWVFKWIKPGISEKEVAKQISIKILELGASGNSFEPIVAANINGAMPHHEPSDYILQDGDMITIDLGCVYDHYTSDMTRTFVLGNKCNNEQLIEIYNCVHKAQLLGINASKINAHTSSVDAICRDYINKSKYKDLFTHGTGHGVGIQVHEKPVVSINQDTILKKNQVITIEPGIYLENVGGVRIEDTIVIKDDQPLILTKGISKDLMFIDWTKH